MSMGVWNRTVRQVSDGAVIADAEVEVRVVQDPDNPDASPVTLATIYEDFDGTTEKANPFQVDSDGVAEFYADGDFYHIVVSANGVTQELLNQPLGTAQARDLVVGADGNVPAWDADGNLVDSGKAAADIGSGSGSSVALDLGDDGTNESDGLTEIATTGDTNNIATEPSADKLLLDMSQNWPASDIADALSTGALDDITEIDGTLRTGSDTTLVTGTAGTSGNAAEWNADGDLVDSGRALGNASEKGVTGLDANAVTGTAGTAGNVPEWNADGDIVDSGQAASDIGSGGGGVDVEDDGTQVVADSSAINFGSNLSVTDDGDGTVTVDASGGGSAVDVEDDGTVVVSGAGAINFGPALNVSDDGDDTVTIGWDSSLPIGSGATAAGTSAIAIGDSASAAGFNAASMGIGASASQAGTVAIGAGAADSGSPNTVIVGRDAEAQGEEGVALGRIAKANALDSVAIGGAASVTHSNSVAIGNGASSTAADQVNVGARDIVQRGNSVLDDSDTLDALADVADLTPADGEVLTWNDSAQMWEPEAGGGGASSLDDLNDVTITSPADDNLLAYNAGTSEFINQTKAEAGFGDAATKGVTGADADAVTGTAGTDGNLAQWNADGDAVDSGKSAADVDSGKVDPEHATDSGTDTYASATNTTPPADGVVIIRDFQSASTTTTPTLDGKTLTTKDGSALWAGAVSGVHELQYDSGSDTYLVLEPIGTAENVNNSPVSRDSSGRAKFANPSTAQDAATQAYVDAQYINDGDTLTWHETDLQSVNGNSYATIFDIAAATELLGGSIMGNETGFRITIDGTVVADRTTNARGQVASSGNAYGVVSLPHAKATSSMKLEVHNSNSTAQSFGWRVVTR